MTPDKKGFTLIELIIVIIIIMALAAVAAPMMGLYKKKAVVSEAITALGTLRNLQRIYYLEHQRYTDSLSSLSLQLSDLNGLYFSKECYGAWSHGIGYSEVFVWCEPWKSTAPRSYEVTNWTYTGSFPFPYIAMDENGGLWGNVEGLQYPRNPEFED